MDLERIRQLVKKNLSQERYKHTLRVKETAVSLAQIYAPNEIEAVKTAALLHDFAKDMVEEQLLSYLYKFNLQDSLLEFHRELWHGPVGAKLAKYDIGIEDVNIYNAIYYHTTGRADMSLVELIIFVADYIEPARNFPGVETVRKDASKAIKVAARKALKNTIIFLLEKDGTIHPDTLLAYNDLTKELGVK